MSEKRILVVNDLHLSFCETMQEGGFHVDYRPNISKQEIPEIIHSYHGLIIRSKIQIDKAFLAKATLLEFIGRAGAGIDNIDEHAVKEAGIYVFNAPEGNRDAVGEHALGMLLMLLNNLHKGHQQVLAGKWDREGNRGTELGSKIVGIYGYGNTGKSFGKKLKGFGCRVLAYDKYRDLSGDPEVEQVDFETFVKLVDVVSIHVPLTNETSCSIGQSFYSKFEKEIYLINTSRGKVLSIKDLLAAIEDGKVIGACLDVLENERFPTYSKEEMELLQRLKDTEKVIFSPHVAGWTFESYQKISEVLSQKILKHYLPSGRLA